MEDLDRQVLARLAEKILGLLGEDDAGAVVRVDDVVTDVEVATEVLELEAGGADRLVSFSYFWNRLPP